MKTNIRRANRTSLFDTLGVPSEHRTDQQILNAADAINIISVSAKPEDDQRTAATRNAIIGNYVARITDRITELT